VRAGPMYDEDYTMQASPEAAAAFHEACVERHIDLRANPVSRFESVLWVFRSLIDSPADMHVDTVRMGARHP
jgi:meso-butanediol dehydrogenase / (S,S)-butanediol dehydrogenase / diacetyl reductase